MAMNTRKKLTGDSMKTDSKQKQIEALKLQIGKLDKQLVTYGEWRSEAMDKKTLYVEQLRILEEVFLF